MISLVTLLQAAEAATDAAAKKGLFGMNSTTSMIVMMVLIFGVMWLFMIRPQQKQQKELAKFRNALEKGQNVITAGGIHGTIKDVKANTVIVQVDRDVTLEIDKTMIMRAPGDGQQK